MPLTVQNIRPLHPGDPQGLSQVFVEVAARATQPAIRNVTYFGGNAIIDALLVLSGWALAGAIALVLAAVLHPPACQPRANSPHHHSSRQSPSTAVSGGLARRFHPAGLVSRC